MKSFRLLFILFLLASLPACAPRPKTPLIVFAAGSLIQPFGDLEKAFEAAHPDIDVQAEYHGSIQVIRQVTDLHLPIDVVATADQALIPQLMYKAKDPQTGKPYASWYLRFATNRLGLAYSDKSKYAGEINAANWPDILARPDVRVGIADPRFDASGYRAMMVFKLAETAMNRPGLFDRIFDGQFRFPVNADGVAESTIIRIPEVLETKKEAHIVLRGASVQLLALLESGDLDYAFEYESVIQQHGLRLVALPDPLNLGSADQNPFYSRVTVLLDFRRFASVKPEFTGEQIGYGITVPSNAPHPQAAEQFIAFLLGPQGRKVMANDHHPIFDTVTANGYKNVPVSLQGLSVSTP